MTKSTSCTDTRQKSAAMYRKAAQIMERGDVSGACWALAYAHSDGRWNGMRLHQQPSKKLCQAFCDVFNEEGRLGYWLDEVGDDGRVVALCFMAAMVEAGDA